MWTALFVICVVMIIGWAMYELAYMMVVIFFPKEGEIAFIVKGGKLHKSIPLVPEKKLNNDGRTLDNGNPDDPRGIEGFLWRWFGARWVGIPGIYKVYGFNVHRHRLRKVPKEGGTLVERWLEIEENPAVVFGLRWKFPRPVLVRQVELPGDGASIDFVVEAIFEVIEPAKAVFDIGGDFMSIIEQAVALAIANACKKNGDLTYALLTKNDLAPNSPFVAGVIAEVNASITTQVGIKVNTLYIPEWVVDSGTQELVKARQSKEKAEQETAGKIAEAEGEKQKTIKEAEGKAREIELRAIAEASRVALWRKEGLTEAQIAEILANETLPKTITHYTPRGAVQISDVVVGGNKGAQ